MRRQLIPLFAVLSLAGCAGGPMGGAGPEPAPVFEPASGLEELRVSRRFMKIKKRTSENEERTIRPFAGLGMVAFPKTPTGDLSARAVIICEAFVRMFSSVDTLTLDDVGRDRQVVTAWPVTSPEVAEDLERKSAAEDRRVPEICREAVARYDSDAGGDAVAEAAAFFESRGKQAVADRISAPVQEGPWLLGWAPGGRKGEVSDVLVLAFDLSYVDTPREAERVFQAWEHAIERNPDLWRQERISNANWSTAIIRWANAIGRDLPFYKALTQ